AVAAHVGGGGEGQRLARALQVGQPIVGDCAQAHALRGEVVGLAVGAGEGGAPALVEYGDVIHPRSGRGLVLDIDEEGAVADDGDDGEHRRNQNQTLEELGHGLPQGWADGRPGMAIWQARMRPVPPRVMKAVRRPGPPKQRFEGKGSGMPQSSVMYSRISPLGETTVMPPRLSGSRPWGRMVMA